MFSRFQLGVAAATLLALWTTVRLVIVRKRLIQASRHVAADVALVAEQAGVSEVLAYDALQRHGGDIADAVLELTTATAAATPTSTPSPAAAAATAAAKASKPQAEAAQPAPSDRTRIRGEAVVLQNLKAKPELNGREGRVLSYDATKGRYAVRLLPAPDFAARTLQVKPSNLLDAAPKSGGGVSNWSAAELCLYSLEEHGGLDAAHMQRVTGLLSVSQRGQSGRLGSATAGHHGLVRLHMKA